MRLLEHPIKVSFVLVIIVICASMWVYPTLFLAPVEYISPKGYVLPKIESNNLYTLYRHYEGIDRFPTEDYAVYVLDPNDDKYLLERFPDANISFVNRFIKQNITYETESGEYPKFPIETLYDGVGDCEDVAILGASILHVHGYNVSLVKNNGHMVIEAEGRHIPESVDVVERYPVTDRAIVYHYWGEIFKSQSSFSTLYEGKIFVENRGNQIGDITLSISGVTESMEIDPFTKVEVDFKVDKDFMLTELFLDGVKVDENKPVGD